MLTRVFKLFQPARQIYLSRLILPVPPKKYFSQQFITQLNPKEILSEGIEDYNNQNYHGAIDKFEFALKLEISDNGEGHIETLEALSNLGSTYHIIGEQQLAFQNCEQALKIINEHQIQDDRKFKILANFGGVLMNLQNFQRAYDVFIEAIDLFIPKMGQGSLESSQLYTKIGLALKEMSRYKEAIQAHEQALHIYKQEFGEDSIHCAPGFISIGENLIELEKYEEGIEYLQKGHFMLEAYRGKADITLVKPLLSIAKGLKELGEYTEAQQHLFKALQINKWNYDDQHHTYIEVQIEIGILYFENEEVQQAKNLFLTVLKTKNLERNPELKKKIDNWLEIIDEYEN